MEGEDPDPFRLQPHSHSQLVMSLNNVFCRNTRGKSTLPWNGQAPCPPPNQQMSEQAVHHDQRAFGPDHRGSAPLPPPPAPSNPAGPSPLLKPNSTFTPALSGLGCLARVALKLCCHLVKTLKLAPPCPRYLVEKVATRAHTHTHTPHECG